MLGSGVNSHYVAVMNATLTLDEAGRVVLPQELRDALHLGAGDVLALEGEGEQIILRPLHTQGNMVQEDGVWVYRVGSPLAASVTDETLDRVRRKGEWDQTP
jgi:AbrB family looped-hinge helix DNA binding protein